MRAAPTDIVVFGSESLSFVRLRKAKKGFEAVQAKRYRLGAVFVPAPVTPQVADAAALTETLRRVRAESGNASKIALLLPDSWFRLNLMELTDLPDSETEAQEVLRWSLKRTLPIPPDMLRIRYIVLHRLESRRRVLIVSAVEKSLASLETCCRESGLDPVIIEPVGLNIWNAIAAGSAPSQGERLLIHVAPDEFTTALFRGEEPIFLRSRQLHGDRSVAQEIRLSASYLRDNLPVKLESCYLSGAGDDDSIRQVVREQFSTEVTRVEAGRFVGVAPGLEATRLEAEIIASAGVLSS